MVVYRRHFDKTTCMYFLIKDKLLENIMKFGKISNIIKNEFDRKPVINEKYIETKINSYNKPTHIFTIIKYQKKADNKEISSDDFIKKILMKKILMINILMKKIKYIFFTIIREFVQFWD